MSLIRRSLFLEAIRKKAEKLLNNCNAGAHGTI
jgi:hypothetical protein